MKMTSAFILTIGDEILLGQILDTNSRYIAKSLSDIGILVAGKLSVGDGRDEINSALEFAFLKSDIVLTTGGLGPTKDDITKKVLGDWFDSPVQTNPIALAHLESLLKRRGREINALTRTQADQPIKSEYIHNQIGTAPGMWFSENGKICISLPGVPYEMTQMLEDEIIPRLKSRLNLDPILHRYIRTIGIPESSLAERIADWEAQLPAHLRLAYLPGSGQVKLRLTGRGLPENQLNSELDTQLKMVLPLIPDVVYSTEDVELEDVVSDLLLALNANLVVIDEISEGLLKSKLLKNDKMPSRISNQLPESIGSSEFWFQIQVRPIGEQHEGEQFILIELHLNINGNKEQIAVEKRLKSFPHKKVNQNMASLWALDMLRRLILENQGIISEKKTT